MDQRRRATDIAAKPSGGNLAAGHADFLLSLMPDADLTLDEIAWRCASDVAAAAARWAPFSGTKSASKKSLRAAEQRADWRARRRWMRGGMFQPDWVIEDRPSTHGAASRPLPRGMRLITMCRTAWKMITFVAGLRGGRWSTRVQDQ